MPIITVKGKKAESKADGSFVKEYLKFKGIRQCEFSDPKEEKLNETVKQVFGKEIVETFISKNYSNQ